MNFELSLQEEIDIYINSNLTPTELFILRLLFLALDGNAKPFVNYVTNTSDGKSVLITVLQNLKSKQVINSTFQIPKPGESLNFREIPINKNFIKKYVRDSHALGKELFDAYPPFININGKMFSIRNFTKAGLFSMEDFCLFYAKSIKNSGVTHDRVMESLAFGKQNNLINYSILEFIASQKYLEIEYIRDSGNVNGYNNTELL